MGETVKVQLEIDTQLGTDAADVDEWTEELVDGLNWTLCDGVEVSRGPPYGLTVWLRTRGELKAVDIADNFAGHLRAEPWCLVEEVLTAEHAER